jgi:hypothetical protein
MDTPYPINSGAQLSIGIVEFVLGFRLYIGLFICRSGATHHHDTAVQTLVNTFSSSWDSWVLPLTGDILVSRGPGFRFHHEFDHRGGKADDWFTTISKHLVAMDDHLWSMEGKLHHVEMIEAKVTALEESTGDLGAQQDMLSSAVEHIDLAQTQLTANAGRGTMAPCNPPHDWQQHGGRCWQGHDEDVAGDDIEPMTHKLEFLEFDGTTDPLPWLNSCEHYFHVRRTPEPQRVVLAAY